jgi:large subunit ribosomal protein L32
MANPTSRHCRSRRNKRRANWKIKAPQWVICSNPSCGEHALPHRICPKCGFYKGRQLLTIKEKKDI